MTKLFTYLKLKLTTLEQTVLLPSGKAKQIIGFAIYNSIHVWSHGVRCSWEEEINQGASTAIKQTMRQQQWREADRRSHNLIRAYISQPLISHHCCLRQCHCTCIMVDLQVQWHCWAQDDPRGSGDKRLTKVDTCNCYKVLNTLLPLRLSCVHSHMS